MANNESLVTLGDSDIKVSRVGLGAWAWGSREFWGSYDPHDIKEAFDTATQGGITWVDTAEIYGMGKSEAFIGNFISGSAVRPAIATKFFPFPWRFLKGQFRAALTASMKRLHLKQIDLYQIHWPFPPMPIDTWLLAMKDAVQEGLVKLTGVSNYNAEQTQRAYEILGNHNVHLASNQVVFSLINRKIEFNGVLKTCKKLGISVIAYSPLGQGVLTGKYTPQNPMPGVRGSRYNRDFLQRVQPLIGLLKEIGNAHGNKTAGQVATNWTIAKGTMPIPGARNARQSREIADTLGWDLTPDEVEALDKASEPFTK